MTVQQFRKRPVVVQAAQLTTETFKQITDWAQPFVGAGEDEHGLFIIIRTLEGDIRARQGDWVIRGVAGEFYPCRNDIFARTYEPVESTAPAALPEPDYLPGYPGKLTKRPDWLDPQPRVWTAEEIARYYLDHCGNCRDAEFYGRAWGHGNPHERHVPVIEDGHGPLAGQPCRCKTCVPADGEAGA